MARFKVGNGIDKYISSLEVLSKSSKEMIGKSIYAGADVVTDRIRAAIEGIPIESSNEAAASGALISGLSSNQKGGLLDGLGITKMELDGGTYNVKVGFDGYNTIRNKNWPKGQPNSMIARSLESGTSFRAKNPVISKATRAARAEAEKAMADALDKEIETHMNM